MGGEKLRIFELINPTGKCMVPGEASRDGKSIRTVLASEACPGHWQWTQEGQLKWDGALPWQSETVLCGQHQAAACAECPKDAKGKWMGEKFCNGDCRWEEDFFNFDQFIFSSICINLYLHQLIFAGGRKIHVFSKIPPSHEWFAFLSA